jgi:hypothetical protein
MIFPGLDAEVQPNPTDRENVMAKTITLSFLLERFARLQNAVKDWENDNSSESIAQWGMSTIKVVSDRLRSEIEFFLDGTADQDKEVSDDAKTMVLAIDTFALAYAAFVRESDSFSSPAKLDRLWIALNRIREVANQKFTVSKPQSVSSMFKAGVTFMQIATIYGWKLEDGSPDGSKVVEELEAPGTHYNPDTWVSPAVESRLRTINQDWSLRPSKRAIAYVRPEEEKPNPNWVPPSIAIMIMAGAPPEQIANVHGITVDDAQQRINAAAEAKEAKEALSLEASKREESSSTASSGQLAGV